MSTNNNFIKNSLDLNLFFSRIMKEHALFLGASFLPKDSEYIQEAFRFNDTFNKFLTKTTELARGVINIGNDAVTDYTLGVEKLTSALTGVDIDTSLTSIQLSLRNQNLHRILDPNLSTEVRSLNNKIIATTRNFVRFKTRILEGVLECKLFTYNYPTLIEHIRREAILYIDLLTKIQNDEFSFDAELIQQEIFWNHIMEEHSLFIRGLLDPHEENLIMTANQFSEEYKTLNNKTYSVVNNPSLSQQITKEALNLTIRIKEFKTAGTEGLLNCGIQSIIAPLLADHVLREANHYIRILESRKNTSIK